MKPLFLRLRNIGPFLEEVIDFEKLGNMFLICGNTGSGKTFIFDAMTYALYGVLTGSRAAHEKEIYSKFCVPEEESFAEFTFETGGDRYRVRRTVPVKYINRNNRESERPSCVTFEQYSFEKREFISFNESTGPTNARIRKVIGLEASEFAQIVLLPQGAFADFLKENSAKKRETLAKLFPVTSYTQIMENVREKAKKLSAEIEGITAQITAVSGKYDFSETDLRLDELQRQLKRTESEEKRLFEMSGKLSVQITQLEQEHQTAVEVEHHRAKLAALEAKREEFAALSQKLNFAEEAGKLGEYIRAKQTAGQNLKNGRKEYEEAHILNEKAAAAFSEIESQKQLIDAEKVQMEQKKLQLQTVRKQLEKALQFAEYKKRSAQARDAFFQAEKQQQEIAAKSKELILQLSETETPEKVIQSLTDKNAELRLKVSECSEICRKSENVCSLKGEIEKLSAERKINDGRLLKVSETVRNIKILLEEAKEKAESQKRQNAAHFLAENLAEGSPCPVCGSVHHPSPAAASSSLDFAAQIRTFEESLQNEEISLKENEKTAAALTAAITEKQNQLEALGSADSVEEAAEKLRKVESDLSENENMLKRAKKIKAQLDDIAPNKIRFDEEAAAAKNSLAAAEAAEAEFERQSFDGKNSAADEIQTLSEKLEKEIGKASAECSAWEQQHEKASAEKAAAEAGLNSAENHMREAEKAEKSAADLLSEKLLDSPFASEQEAASALMNEDEYAAQKAALQQYNEEIKSEKLLSGSAGKTRSLKEISEELDAGKNSLEKTQSDYAAVKEEHRKITAEYSSFKSSVDMVKDLEKSREEKEKQRVPLARLADDLNGSNPHKIQFDSWALGMYFEQVVEYAGRRFFNISNGRYTFKLSSADNARGGNGYKGLDLLVTDSYTGTDRDTATLSGGETFMASISLALALTDVVQNKSGGIQLDSLFIDEGFGTLDGETLDKALEILNELRETKTVGIISHVETLQTSIPAQVQVKKTSCGSHIKIIC